jgi:hypothetical protein
MDFTIPDNKIEENIIDFGRKIGYLSIGRGINSNEFSFVRCFNRSGFPRFHLIVRKDLGKNILFSLHLDQKKPIYRNQTAHNADYHGPLIDEEIERIKRFL